MNLAEVIVAASLLLSASSGAAQMGSASTAALQRSRLQAAAVEQIEAQFLASAPLIAAAAAQHAPEPSAGCAAAAQWMQQQLQAGLPPLAAGLQRQLSVDASGEQVQMLIAGSGSLRRTRLLHPVAFGLCGLEEAPAHTGAASASSGDEPIEEASDATR